MMIVIESPELATNYSTEFAKMFERKQFGPTKAKTIPNPVITVSGTRIETCFASENRCEDRIVTTLSGSRRSIRFLAFSFTSTPIAQAMLDRHASGVSLAGVFETTGSDTPYSAYGKLKQQGIEVYTDGNPYAMHHKAIIIDERIVIFGSYNFSDNANTSNDENLLIVESPEIARAFLAEYDRIVAVAKNPPKRR
jgi:phosphatidylserine/phosphatidylglycerophosphate/cardiolipin synthase-like enzyme